VLVLRVLDLPNIVRWYSTACRPREHDARGRARATLFTVTRLQDQDLAMKPLARPMDDSS